MITHKKIGVFSALIMAVIVIILTALYVNPNIYSSISSISEPLYTKTMDKTKVLSIQIIADKENWNTMLKNASSEEYIPATLIINNTKIENVGIRPKGNSSLNIVAQDDTTDRYSFKIEFDHYIKGQTWQGLDKLVLNNMQGDASYMKEYISYDIMNYIGVNSPIFSFADISVNGDSWGFYLAIETMEDSYAKRTYGNDHGQLYKPESMGMGGGAPRNEFIDNNNKPAMPNLNNDFQGQPMQDFQNNEDMKGFGGGMGMANNGVSLQYTDDNTSSYSAIFDTSVFKSTDNDYKRVVNSLKKLSEGKDLEQVVDVEDVLKYFAAHTVVVNLDSYISNMGHNYYLYVYNGKLTMLPWDYNLAFGGFQSKDASSVVNFPIDTPVSGVSLEDRPILGKLLENEEYLALYHSYLKEIVDGYFNSGIFEQTIDSLNTLISPYVENDPSAFYDFQTYKKAIEELKKLGFLRAKSIDGQLNGTVPSTTDTQKSSSNLLVDSATIDLSLLGNMDMGGAPGGADGPGNMMGNMNPETMKSAMDIISSRNSQELSEDQLNQLKDLGLEDTDIENLKNILQNGFGRRGNNQPPNQNNTKLSNTNQLLDANSLKLIVGCSIAIISGLVFVFLYKRKK